MNTAEGRKAAITKPGERQLRIERVFYAPRQKVFEAFIDPERIPLWWGPEGSTTVVEKMEPRTGGDWQFLTEQDGEQIRFRGSYREVTPHERIAQTFEWDGMPGYVSIDDSSFEDLGDRTKVVTISTFFFNEEREGMLSSGMEKGLNETYDRLESLLAG